MRTTASVVHRSCLFSPSSYRIWAEHEEQKGVLDSSAGFFTATCKVSPDAMSEIEGLAPRPANAGWLRANHLRVSDPEHLPWPGLFCVMTDQSQFDDRPVAPATRPWKRGFVAALVLGLILGAGLMALWEIYGSAPLGLPQPGVAANPPNETAQAIKDLQTTEEKIVQLQSVQQTLASEQAETKTIVRPSYRIER